MEWPIAFLFRTRRKGRRRGRGGGGVGDGGGGGGERGGGRKEVEEVKEEEGEEEKEREEKSEKASDRCRWKRRQEGDTSATSLTTPMLTPPRQFRRPMNERRYSNASFRTLPHASARFRAPSPHTKQSEINRKQIAAVISCLFPRRISFPSPSRDGIPPRFNISELPGPKRMSLLSLSPIKFNPHSNTTNANFSYSETRVESQLLCQYHP